MTGYKNYSIITGVYLFCGSIWNMTNFQTYEFAYESGKDLLSVTSRSWIRPGKAGAFLWLTENTKGIDHVIRHSLRASSDAATHKAGGTPGRMFGEVHSVSGTWERERGKSGGAWIKGLLMKFDDLSWKWNKNIFFDIFRTCTINKPIWQVTIIEAGHVHNLQSFPAYSAVIISENEILFTKRLNCHIKQYQHCHSCWVTASQIHIFCL